MSPGLPSFDAFLNPVTPLCSIIFQGFPGVPGSMGPKVSYVSVLGKVCDKGHTGLGAMSPLDHSLFQGDRGETGSKGEQVWLHPFLSAPVATISPRRTHIPKAGFQLPISCL